MFWRRVLRLWTYSGAVRAAMTAWVRENPDTQSGPPAGGPQAAVVPAEAMNVIAPPDPVAGFAAPLIEFG